MNDNALLAAVLREVADIYDYALRKCNILPGDLPRVLNARLRARAAELDPPEKNERKE
jgi:hypothetical protein